MKKLLFYILLACAFPAVCESEHGTSALLEPKENSCTVILMQDESHYIVHPHTGIRYKFNVNLIPVTHIYENHVDMNQDWPEQHCIDICLNYRKYKIIGYISSGLEGDVYKIRAQDTGTTYALKVYKYPDAQTGDALIIQKAKESKDFINLPIEVNLEYQYSILPFLEKSFADVAKEILVNQPNLELNERIKNLNIMFIKSMLFISKCKEALKKDNLDLGDFHLGNLMIDKNKQIKRIDFGFLKNNVQQA